MRRRRRRGRDPLELSTWLPVYRRICADFGYDEAEDLKSASMLVRMLRNRGASSLEIVRRGFPSSVIVCGGSDSLTEELSRHEFSADDFIVAADTAASVLRTIGIVPKMIVTDLDGSVEDQISANSNGAAVFVHAHGDNQQAIRKHLMRFPGLLVGTCQCEPPLGIFNFGGFTDGDRAVCACAELGATDVWLAGFDFDRPSSKPGRSIEVKLRKLRWAKEILDMLSQQGLRIRHL